ncbi:hypothetical protein D3C84_293670 [compost metagenome]
MQEEYGDYLHRFFHRLGEAGKQPAQEHADRHRTEDYGEHLHHLGELQRNGLVTVHEVRQRQVDDQIGGAGRSITDFKANADLIPATPGMQVRVLVRKAW